ncbi:hypothetical protein KRX57_04520 [Weeksellaceae bacterium TAE3-ERU29]|nr:hypothetical protein [Weeksellaceae bacterium TAE3-ERU29]
MNTEARKISFIQDYLKINDERILNAVEKFFYKTKSEVFEEKSFKPMSLEVFNNEIDKAIEDENNNKITDTETLKKRIQKWT